MNCDKAAEAMSAELDGELNEQERLRLREHLQTCPDCRELYEQLRLSQQAFSEAQSELPDRLHESVMAAIRNEKKRSARRPLYIAFSAGLAAVLLLALLSSGVFDLRTLRAPEAAASMANAVQGNAESVQALSDELGQAILVLEELPAELAELPAEYLPQNGAECRTVSLQEGKRLHARYGGTFCQPQGKMQRQPDTLVILSNALDRFD